MVFYNIAQVAINGWTVFVILAHLFSGSLPFIDVNIPLKDSSVAVWPLWIHYCDKYLEFLDTFFMLVRGNFKQVSFLHMYHHATIVFAWHVACHICWKVSCFPLMFKIYFRS